MKQHHHQKRFGTVSISKGFITLEQFTEAIKIQAEEDLESSNHRRLGEILIDLGYMNSSQVNGVLEELIKAAFMYECPECGILIYKCPNCKAELR